MQTAQARSYLTIIIVAAAGLLAAAIAASIFLPSLAKVPFEKSEELYVIYYGHLVDGSGAITPQARMILDANPSMVIVPHSFPDGELNLTPELRQSFQDKGIKVITYTWTNYGNRPLAEVIAEIDSYIAQSDGIFVDEVTNLQTEAEFSYYSAVYDHVKENHGDEKLVIMNPGHYQVDERIMGITDIASLEEEWIYHGSMPWKSEYPPSRFMGVSSNEYCGGQCVTGENALARTVEAWDSGIGYHFSTDRYIDLPAWFGTYVSAVNNEKEEAAGSDNLSSTDDLPPD